MEKEVIARKIAELGTLEPWNHQYEQNYNLRTIKPSNLSQSPGNNLKKWKRMNQLLG